MIELTVFSATCDTISGVSNKTGSEYSFRVQTVYINEGKPVLSETSLTLNKNQNPLNIGVYEVLPSAVYIDRNKRISISVNPDTVKFKRNLPEAKAS